MIAARSLGLPLAFLRRDRRIEASYKAGLVLRVGGALATVIVFFFISRTFGAATAGMDLYGASYFAFVLVGIAVVQYLSVNVGGLGAALRESQTTGTLELMLMSPSRLWVILLSSALWLQLTATLGAALYVIAGMALGADFGRTDLPATVLGLLLSMIAFAGLGLLAASVVLVVKRGNPVGWVIRGASVVLSGVFYPIDVLPPVLQAAGRVLPMTHALDILRGSVLQGQGVAELAGSLLVLAMLSVVSLVLGLGACALSIHLGRVDGSLAQY